MSFDFNDAEQSKPRGELIPHGTAVPVHMTIRPGGAGDGGWLKRSAKDALMLDAEFTVIEGEHAKRKFWSYFTVDGETDGQKEAGAISRSNIRAMLESARGINPAAIDEKAVAARRISGFEDLDGLRFWCVVKVEKGTGGYKDKNQFSYAITPDRKEWSKLEQVVSASGGAARSATGGGGGTGSIAKAAGARPSWATDSKQPAQAAHRTDIDDRIPF